MDDRDDFRESFAKWLRESLGHRVQEAKRFDEALDAFAREKFDVAIVDYSLDPSGRGDGIDLLGEFKQIDPTFPVVVITGYGNRPVAKRALRAGALWYLDKPPDMVEIEILLGLAAKSRDRSSQQLLSAISEAIASAQDTEELLAALGETAAKLLKAAFCSVVTVNPETNKSARRENLPQLLSVRRALDRSIHAGKADIVTVTDRNMAIEREARLTVRGIGLFPCPPRPRPSAVLIAYYAVVPTEREAVEIREAGEELGQVIGAALPTLYLQQVNEEIAALGQALLRSGSFEEAYAAIAHSIMTTLQIDNFYLCVYESARFQLSFPIARERGKSIEIKPITLRGIEDLEGASLSAYVVRTGEPLELPDLPSLENFEVPFRQVGEVKTKSYLGIPIRLDSSRPAFGVLSIQSETEGRFSGSCQRAAREIANLSAPTLARLRKVALGEEVLAHILRRSPAEVIRETAQALKELVFADIIAFYPYETDRNAFGTPTVVIGHSPASVDTVTWPYEEPSLKRLLKLREHFAPEIEGDRVFVGVWLEALGALSSCGILLRASEEGQVQGALLLHFRSRRAFTQEEQGEIRRFAKRAALALYIAEILEERKQMDMRSRAESEVIDAANTHDRNALAAVLSDAALKVWRGRAVKLRVLLYDRKSEKYHNLDGTTAGSDIPSGGFTVEGRESLDPPAESTLRRGDSMERMRSIRIPIRVGDSRVGFLFCDADEPILILRDREFLERLARRLGGSLIAAAREQRVELIREVAERAAKDPANALATVTEITHRIATGAGGAPTSTTIFLLTGSILEPVSAFPLEKLLEFRELVGSLSIDPSQGRRRGIVARAAVKRETQLVLNVASDEDYITVDSRTKAELAVPVFGFDKKVVGVLNLEFQNPSVLTEDDRSLVETLADQTTVVNVIQTQALALTEAEKLTTMSAALAILGIDAAETGHRFRGLSGSLRKEVELCERYLAHLNPSNGGALSLLLRWGFYPGGISKRLDRLRQILLRLKDGLAMVDLQGSTESVMKRTDVQVTAWVITLGETWREQERGKKPRVEIEVEEQARSEDVVCVNEYWLTRCVSIILDNSLRAVRRLEDEPRTVRILTQDVGEEALQVVVEDNGLGVPEKVAAYLFSSPIPSEISEPGGHGTGCLIASFIAQLYGGRIYLDRRFVRGTRVVIELPLSLASNQLLF